jgi:hypothetical protein
VAASPYPAYILISLSLWVEVSPQNNACTDDPLSLEGEGWGEGIRAQHHLHADEK